VHGTRGRSLGRRAEVIGERRLGAARAVAQQTAVKAFPDRLRHSKPRARGV